MKTAKIKYDGQYFDVRVNDDLSVELPSGQILKEEQVEWLPPANGTMFALGLNYADHARELAFEPPKEPLIFIKANNTYIGHNKQTWRPDHVDYMHYECELVAVIGKTAKNVKRENALEYVQGYTLCNDYAIRDYLENYYRPNLRVKNRLSTTPVGPYIIDRTLVKEPNNLVLKTWVNGELRQEGTTADMIFNVPFLIEYISSFMTLQPGDMIATGTPEGLSDVVPGDEVIVEIEGIGKLRNYIVSETEFFNTVK
ncbi:fumarylacetoacetate hydrolase family protein [Acinetobacter oleivorans]|uniref:fumarylacetoacetate hydrolase family protein n=1 Tax=Acinetobacter TaxID=469 RepID=UPI00178CA2F3|nr:MULTISPECIES: fumarylacetoacetate hydrolase family protein [Acinetobacter]MCG6037476.1 fumarylacetoacetate hydrolase family protein [Acinetobacter baumannii]MBE2173831.1 fumarylacetoacetate hydrolase family protein [Acinetobacter oleivorans]MBN6513243.1 fumarylacetoacetate hydrolase family protein [Acinetobacter pittii]HCH7477813.1 fumarylacetoacetate hydrolase family protein [Acinetobacter baumannii]HCH7479450.1 fumarylacetoacetate hydrolase family protein [Acinetobacter baumannii]